MRFAVETLRQMTDPFLSRAGKAEPASINADSVSLHVLERIDPRTILNVIYKDTQTGHIPFPLPTMIVFASVFFDPRAAMHIDKISGINAISVQMSLDLLTGDLGKTQLSSERLWIIGQPDVRLRWLDDGKFRVEVRGVDYFNLDIGKVT